MPVPFDEKAVQQSVFDALIGARERFGDKEIIEDQDRKPLTYTGLIRAAFVLGRKIAAMTEPGERVAIMLPSSMGMVVTFFGLHAFGRTPVMLNFTSGARNLKAACATAGVKKILTPDFLRKDGAAEVMIDATPDVFNHNLETVPRLYLKIRPGARYFHSLRLLQMVKERDPNQFTKSGIMVGLGETKEEVMQVMDDMRSAGVDFITIGQYLQPTRKHAALDRFVTPEEFNAYEAIARAKGFLMVSASPLTRSSHHAGDDFARLKAAREAQNGR